MNPEARAQRPSLRTHIWETTHFPRRGGYRAKTQPSLTQPSTSVSARDLGGPGRAPDGEAPLLLGEVKQGQVWVVHGKVTYKKWLGVLLPLPARPYGKASKAAAACE